MKEHWHICMLIFNWLITWHLNVILFIWNASFTESQPDVIFSLIIWIDNVSWLRTRCCDYKRCNGITMVTIWMLADRCITDDVCCCVHKFQQSLSLSLISSFNRDSNECSKCNDHLCLRSLKASTNTISNNRRILKGCQQCMQEITL